MGNPYKGLQPFSEEDEQYFSGREAEIEQAIVSMYSSSLIVLCGESGVGKTSLIRAGILPAVKSGEHRVAAILFREWQSKDFLLQLREHIFTEVLAAINRLKDNEKVENAQILSTTEIVSVQTDAKDQLGVAPSEIVTTNTEKAQKRITLAELKAALREGMGNDSDPDTVPLDRLMKECCAAFYGRIFFIFDQFEEYMYYHPADSPGAKFDEVFARAVNDPDIAASFMLCLRDDGLGRLQRLKRRIPGLLGNVIRLEHLSEKGARQAILKPAALFSGKAKVTVDPKLVDALITQVREDVLEIDSFSEPASKQMNENSQGRYKALAIEAVMTRLWDAQVGSCLTKNENIKDNIDQTLELSLDGLKELARDKEPQESEAKYVVRTYFDGKMNFFEGKEKNDAVEILRYLVRPGGQKKAVSVNDLVSETTLTVQRVKTLLEGLTKTEVLLKLKDIEPDTYELRHDVMAFAVNDWCRRQLQISREKQIRRKAGTNIMLIAAGAMICIALFSYRRLSALNDDLKKQIDLVNYQKARADAAEDKLKSRKLIDQATPTLGVPDQEYEVLPLATFYLEGEVSEKRFVYEPFPMALLVLRCATRHAQSPSLLQTTPKNAEFSLLNRYLPELPSPDRKLMVAIEEDDQALKDKNGPGVYQPVVCDARTLLVNCVLSPIAGIQIKRIGFSLDSSIFAIDGLGADNKPVTVRWELNITDPSKKAPLKTTESLEEVLGLSKATDEDRRFAIKECPKDCQEGVFYTYREVRDRWIQDALEYAHTMDDLQAKSVEESAKTAYQDVAIKQLPSQKAARAYEIAAKDPTGAENLYRSALQDLGLSSEIADVTLKEGVKNLREYYKSTGDNAAAINNQNEAVKYYNKCFEVDPASNPDLKDPLQRFNKVKQAISYVLQGNKARDQDHNSQAAFDLYTKAHDFAPDYLVHLEPLKESQQAPPSASSAPPSSMNPFPTATPSPETSVPAAVSH